MIDVLKYDEKAVCSMCGARGNAGTLQTSAVNTSRIRVDEEYFDVKKDVEDLNDRQWGF